MATETITRHTDDIDGSDAVGTFRITVTDEHGKTMDVEIDLSEAHAAELNDFLAPHVENGRKIPAQRRTTAAKPAGSSNGRRTDGEVAKIRAWAIENGYQVAPRGRVPKGVADAYHTASR